MVGIVTKIGYEVQAMNGEEMPDGLSYPDQILFLELRLLYGQYRKGEVSRETAVREKRKLLSEYKNNQFRAYMGAAWCDLVRRTELTRAEFRKNPCIENAIMLVNAIEGGKNENHDDRKPG